MEFPSTYGITNKMEFPSTYDSKKKNKMELTSTYGRSYRKPNGDQAING